MSLVFHPRRYGPKLAKLCASCGKQIDDDSTHCRNCARSQARDRMAHVSRLGRMACHSPEAQARRSSTQQRNATARWRWTGKGKPACLDKNFYLSNVSPKLEEVTLGMIAETLGVSKAYASEIKRGKRTPHPRHWCKLARLVGVDLKQTR